MSIPLVANNNIEVENLLNDWKKEDQIWLGRKVKHIAHPSFFKTWEIVICTITIIGLCVILGLYYKRRNAWAAKQADFELKIVPILSTRPEWVDKVNSWQMCSEDQLWLLHVYQLHELGVDFGNYKSDFTTFPDNKIALNILSHKGSLNHILYKTTEFKCKIDIDRLPDAIYLLKNLKKFECFQKGLKEAPDTSKFPDLEHLDLGLNELERAPDISKNPKLISLILHRNRLKTPPDTSKNPNLKDLALHENALESPPDVSFNKELTFLALSHNLISSAPDLTNNPKLEVLGISTTNISTVPDTRNNLELVELDLSYNYQIKHMDPPVHLKKLKNLEVTDVPISTHDLQQWASQNGVFLW